MKIAIVGNTGMLGSTLQKFFNLYSKDIELIISKRFDYKKKLEFIDSLKGSDYIINCSGAIPQRINDSRNKIHKENYYKINYLIPEVLLENNFKVIQPCTDCVYKGDPKAAPYNLKSKYDSLELYGISKAKLYSRKTYQDNLNSIKVLRSSIVGIDKLNKSLYSWSLNKVKSSSIIKGYTNHFWNGITTLKWAQLCLKVIKDFDSYPPISLVGTNNISKYELIKDILETNHIFPDKYLKPTEADNTIDRRLYIGENNFGNIRNLLKELKEFNDI